MRKMPGMEADVGANTMPMEGISYVRANGRPYETIRATGNPDQQSLVSKYEIFRDHLAQMLFELTKDNENIKYVLGEQVPSMQPKETSRTRAMGLGCGVRDHF